ncbi:MAG: acyl-ACP--UDP-N-acetylglucosamine O-acyltransferase [Candidatus Egerieousia sp.]
MENAIVHPNAKIGKNVVISPFATIAEHVEIGDGTWIGPYVSINDYVKIGKNCKIFNGAVIGALPQDLKFKGEETYVEIGDNVMIREYCTVSRGTAASGKYKTTIGNDSFLMAYVHVAHDCRIGNHVILVSYVGLAGETDVDDWAIVGGSSGVHQFTRIGCHAMLSGGSYVGKDIPPYAMVGKRPVSFCGINSVGLRRRGFTAEQIERIKDVYRIIYQSGMNVGMACKVAQEQLPDSEEKQTILNFVEGSKRGIVGYNPKQASEE